MRRGLVLEGGGAKGAFQFGALLALKEAGITFDAVAGTSVGALNAALLAADRVDEGKALWTNLSTSKIFRLRIAGLLLLPLSVFCHLFVATSHQHLWGITPLPLKILFFIIRRLPWLLLPAFLVWLAYRGPGSLDGCMIALAAFLIFPALLAPDTGYSRTLHAFMCIAAVYPLWGEPWSPLHLVAVVIFLPPIIWFLGVTLQVINLAMFDPAPLRDIVERVVYSGLKVPVFATTTSQISYFDPDALSYLGVGARSGPVFYEPMALAATCAQYERLDQKEAKAQVEALLASAALPLGVVPGRFSAAGEPLIDGGVVDNLPWFPLIADFPCDELVFICCNPFRWDDASARAEWAANDRLARVRAMQFSPPTVNAAHGKPADVMNEPPRVVERVEPSAWPSSIVVIAPTEPLGSFFSATINFSGARARALLAQGFQMGRAAIVQQLLKPRPGEQAVSLLNPTAPC